MSTLFGNLNGIAAGIYQLVRQEFIDRPLPVPSNDVMNITYTAPGAGGVLRRLYDLLAETVSVRSYGAVLDGVTDDSAALRAAQLMAGRRTIRIDGVMHIAAPVTITSPIIDTMGRIFSDGSKVTIANGMRIRPEWFGDTYGNIQRAVDTTPPPGGVIGLEHKTYPPSYDTATPGMFDNRGGTPGVDYLVKKGIKIEGAKLPRYAEGNGSMIGGTVIQGSFYVSAEADGFDIDNVGVDCGLDVQASVYGGVLHHDGFCLLQTNKAAPQYGHGQRIGHIRGLCATGLSLGHAVLIEASNGATVGYAEGRGGRFGVVLKSHHLNAGTLIGRGNSLTDVLVKSDVYANSYQVQIGQVICETAAPGVVEPGFGLMVQAPAAGSGAIQIGMVHVSYKDTGVSLQGGGFFPMTDIVIGSLITQGCKNSLEYIGGLNRSRIGSANLNGSTNVPVYVDTLTVSKDNRIESLLVDGGVNGAYLAGKMSIGNACFKNVNTFGIEYANAAARINIDSYDLDNVPNFWNATQPLQNGWTNSGGGNGFYLDASAGKVHLTGLMTGGTAGLITTLPANLRPFQAQRFACLGFNGAVYSTVEVIVTPDGDVIASNFAAASAHLSLNGVSWSMPF